MGFYLSQIETPFPLAILAAGFLNVMTKRDVPLIRKTFDQVVRGYELGKVSQKLLGVRFESLWERSVSDLRREFGLVGEKFEFSWSADPRILDELFMHGSPG